MLKRIFPQTLFQKAAFIFLVGILMKSLFVNIGFAQEIYPFLNSRITYTVLEKDANIFRLQPPDTKLVIINFANGDLLRSYHYYVKREITDFKLQLMEYDFFTRIYLRDDMINLGVLDMFSEKEVFRFHKEIYAHFQAFRSLKYPSKLEKIHKMYLEILKTARGYLDFDAGDDESIFENSTVVYRIMGIYNAYANQKRLLEATLLLNNLLEENDIQPY